MFVLCCLPLSDLQFIRRSLQRVRRDPPVDVIAHIATAHAAVVAVAAVMFPRKKGRKPQSRKNKTLYVPSTSIQ